MATSSGECDGGDDGGNEDDDMGPASLLLAIMDTDSSFSLFRVHNRLALERYVSDTGELLTAKHKPVEASAEHEDRPAAATARGGAGGGKNKKRTLPASQTAPAAASADEVELG